MIHFKLKQVNQLSSGLTIQLVYATEPHQSYPAHFQHSIIINDKAFNLIYPNFYRHTANSSIYFIYGTHYYSKSEIYAIVQELSVLVEQIKSKTIIQIEPCYFYSYKINRILRHARLMYHYRTPILSFLNQLIIFLRKAIDCPNYTGIYFIGF